MASPILNRRRLLRRLWSLLAGVIGTFCLTWFYLWYTESKILPVEYRRLPPNYYSWFRKELALPQNNPDLPPPQGKHGKYVLYDQHVQLLGWGNAMQDMIMNAHLSYMAERTFVMYNYTWDVGVGDYSKWGDSIIPAQIPISVYAKGPIAGAPYPADKYRQPAVSVPFFRSICPHPTMLNVDNIKHEIGEPSALTIMTHFANRLKSIDDGCVEFQYNTGQVLDFYIMGDGKRMADLWPPLLESPILTEWQWSDTITSALESNYKIVHPGAGIRDSQSAELPGLLALHVRRGDFEDHCKHLAKWKSAYNAFNTRDGFPDQYTPPQNGEWGEASPEGLEFYGKHCFPSTKDIVEKVYQVRADAKRQGRNLDRIYVLTNGKSDWFAELKAALNELGGWKSIHSSRELWLTREQKYVAQAIDMLIATRADTFVGNAWSSLTSNVNMLRVVQHHGPQTSRFW